MSELLQHVVVTLVALSAAWLVLHRVFGVFGRSDKNAGPGCSSCASGQGACAHGSGTATARRGGLSTPAGTAAPLTFHRPTRGGRS